MSARMLMAAVAALFAAAGAPGQDVVVLRHTARVEAGRGLTLGDIAVVSGPGSEGLGGVTICADPGAEAGSTGGWLRVDLELVRSKLVGALGERGEMLALSGSACEVRVLPAAPAAREPAPIAVAGAAAPDATGLMGEMTVRGAIARELARILGAAPEDLRLSFDAEDGVFLCRSTEGSVLEVSPAGTSERMPVAVAVYEPGGGVERRTVRVGVEIRRQVAVVARTVERGRTIGAGDIAAEDRWFAPGDRPIAPGDAVGSVARKRVRPGESLDGQHIEPPVLIHKGDRLFVRVVTRGIVMTRDARALEDGREGEQIAFAATIDPSQRFGAVVVGPGDALVWAAAPGPSGTRLAIPGVER